MNIDHDLRDLRPNVASVANRIDDAALRCAGWSLARAAGAAPQLPRK